MPTYDYRCTACGHRFERFESINDDKLKACPKCSKKKAKRMLGTGAGLIFKGAGFYTTDYKKPGDTGTDKTDKKAPEKSPEKSPEKKSESKEKNKGESKK